MTNPLYSIEKTPTTSAAAIREFDIRYNAALAAAKANGWVDQLGALVPTASPMVTFPVSQLRTKYTRTTGENKSKTFDEKSFDIKSEEFDDGYEAELKKIFEQVFAYRRWKDAPAALIQAEERFRHAQIAALLEAGESTTCVDGENFFSTSHPANLHDTTVGTYSNYQSTTKDVVSIANIEAEVTLMKSSVKDENGDKMGLNPKTILVPSEKFEKVNNLLKQGMIADPGGVAAGVSNPYQGGFQVIEVPEFTDANDWYLLDASTLGNLDPWVVLRQTVPSSLALRKFDESSDFFKDTGKLKISSHIWYGFALALPHAIRKIKGA